MNRKNGEGEAEQRAGSLTDALGKLLGSSELQQAGVKQAVAGKGGGHAEASPIGQGRRGTSTSRRAGRAKPWMDDVDIQDANRDQLEQIIAGLTEGVILIETDQTIRWANDAALRMHGVSHVADLGRDVTEYRQRFRLKYRNNHQLRGGQYPIERVIAGENFSDVIVEVFPPGAAEAISVHRVRSLVLTTPGGEPDVLVLVLKDASDWANAEQKFERAFAANPAPAVICRLSDQRYIKVNRGFLEMTAYDSEQVIGRSVYEIDILEGAAHKDAAIRRLALAETIPQMEASIHGADGSRRPVVVAGQPIDVGPEQCMLFTFVDLSVRKRIERTLKASEERFQKSFCMLPVPSAVLRSDTLELLNVNDAFAAVMGTTMADLRAGLEPPARRRIDELRAEVARVRELGHLKNAPLRVQSANGSAIDGLMSIEEVAIDEQNCLLIAWLDITERKRAENELVRAVELVTKDSSWFSQLLIEKLDAVRARADHGASPRIENLTRREREVFDMLYTGQADKEIAKALNVAPATVRNHVAAIYAKLDLHSRAGLILWARAQGHPAPGDGRR